MRSWSVILGGQSSLTMCRLNLNFQILGEILVCHNGRSIIFDDVHVESELSNSRWDPGLSYWGGSIIFDHVRAKSELSNSRWDPGLSYWGEGVNHLLTMCMLNHNFKILGEIPGLSYLEEGVNNLLMMCMVNLNFQILGEILVCHTGGGQSSLTMCRLNLKFKMLSSIWP